MFPSGNQSGEKIDNVFASDSDGEDNEEEEDSIFDKPITNKTVGRGPATLKDFLSSIGLDFVYNTLVNMGIETVEDLEDLSEE